MFFMDLDTSPTNKDIFKVKHINNVIDTIATPKKITDHTIPILTANGRLNV